MSRRRSWLPDWRTMRENHLLTYPSCAICEDAERVHVHHLRYRGARGKSERPGDLVTLCVFHHADLHRSLKPAATAVQGTIDYIAAKLCASNENQVISPRRQGIMGAWTGTISRRAPGEPRTTAKPSLAAVAGLPPWRPSERSTPCLTSVPRSAPRTRRARRPVCASGSRASTRTGNRQPRSGRDSLRAMAAPGCGVPPK